MLPNSPISPSPSRSLACLSLALCVALTLASCGRQGTPPVGPEPKAAAAKPKPQEGQGPPVEVYAYNPAGKPDPFRPFGVAPAEKKQAKREPSSLRDMEVGQLKLVGIAQGPQGAVALVEDASGRGYVVSRGMRIGAAGGLVKDISAGGIRVEETLRSYTGRVQTRSVSLKLVPQEH